MAFYRLNAKGVYIPMTREEKEIIKSKVLPGFQFRISDLAQPPTVEELIADPVYQGFVLPGYQEAKRQAVAVEWQVAQEAQRADLAEQRALAAESEAGITPLRGVLSLRLYIRTGEMSQGHQPRFP